MIRNIFRQLFGMKMAMLYLAIFALAIGVATFIENDFGTDAAQKWIYRATWFEVLLVLFSGSIVQNILKYRMVQRRMWSVLLFHLSILVILIGSAITRFSGFEGVMHIREGDTVNRFYSSEDYINLSFYTNSNIPTTLHEPVLFSSLGGNHFHQSYLVESQEVDVELLEFIPNPVEVVEQVEAGSKAFQVVFGGSNGRTESWVMEGEKRQISGTSFALSNSEPADVLIFSREGRWYFKSADTYSVRVMATGEIDTISPFEETSLRLRALYQNMSQPKSPFVFAKVENSVERRLESEKIKIDNSSTVGLKLKVQVGDKSIVKTVVGSGGWANQPIPFDWGSGRVEISFGSKMREVPFSIKLHRFEMDRYPGTNSPKSYASEVQVIDPSAGVDQAYRIYMNHILDYKGYRFFQSSYDRDERGTYLSVNHDFWGTWISYLGYALLTLGMIWTLFSKNTRFRQLSDMIKKSSSVSAFVLFGLIASNNVAAQTQVETLPVPSEMHAEQFSSLIVQDFKGRMKPMHTLSREVMRKVHGSETFNGHSADAVMLGCFADPNAWYGAKLIKLSKHDSIGHLIGVDGPYAAYKDFFNSDGSYKLEARVDLANSVNPADKGVTEKGLLKVDEKINIMHTVFSGTAFRIVPIAGDPNNTWVSTHEHGAAAQSEIASRFFPAYKQALQGAMLNGDYALANALVVELDKYQRNVGAEVLPSDAKRSAEIWLNEWTPFNKLALIYTLLGLLFLLLQFIQIFRPKTKLKWVFRILFGALVLAFLLHTTGLGVRWFVSGRAPWSNGYESMIYIGWTTTLAGLLFARRSWGGLAATNVLSGVVLLIAMLSYLNPEITPLVPVLRSYWLTIHVSLEAGSYGFLMLGAVMGIINLLMMLAMNKRNEKTVRKLIKELSYRSEMTLIGGLFMLSVGTYLGGVWANESWGRYWGWDAKETWALVSILVYAFILHMRMIPGLKGMFAYNVATLFGLASIIMTYFGVNYYLSGLHSYAAGDPVPIPSWVYYSVAALTLVSLGAWWKNRKFKV
ncbi:MAG: cytochrome c biogenesis protein CcsA [Flavobacteriia bacterium]|nr:cytochrome c biogenesis protein CcsA [Flavobacteriia bacterium]